ncbi:hypothetical protein AB0O90_07380 [Microbacterium testaceum]|uniref:hypothetical protein n=1 Tax=Microbacterium testaceum TaxID=2033 RepID=UPI00341EBBD7
MKNNPEAAAIDHGLPRRTVLAGAAWTIPVIATATIAPAASASGTLELAFDKSTYNGTACSTISGAFVTATKNNIPQAGVSITVTLSNGYTFSGGATTTTDVSGANGQYTLPDISVPSIGGTISLQALAGTATASATVTATPGPASVNYYSYTGLTGIPTDAVVTTVATCSDDAGGHYARVLASDGTLYGSHNGSAFTVVATGVTHLAAADRAAIYAKTNNKVTYYSYVDVDGIPSDVTITDVATCADDAGGHWARVLLSDGNGYYSHNGGAFVASIITNATHISNGADGAIAVADANNTVTYYSYNFVGGIPSAAAITDVATAGSGDGGHWAWALADGTLYYSLDGSTFAAGLSNVTHLAAAAGSSIYATADNAVFYYTYTYIGGIPSDATITTVATAQDDAGGHYGWVLTSDGTLYWSQNGSAFTAAANNVTRLAAADKANIYAQSQPC